MVNDSHCRMADMIQEYTTGFVPHISVADAHARQRDSSPMRKGHQSGEYHVALTGATGNVGCITCQLLIEDPQVQTVYLLNRRNASPAKQRIIEAMREKGLDPSILDSSTTRIIYLEIDFSKKKLGLGDAEYTDLQSTVTHIIHSAWELRFNADLEYFEKMHIAGTRQLIDLALGSPHKRCPRLVFLSTLAAAIEYSGPSDIPVIGDTCGLVLVPERPIDDLLMPLQDQGYGQSKYVCERMLVRAIPFGLRATVTRVGQLSGMPKNGQWSKYEYSAILIRAILKMRICPTDMPSYRWLPCDVAASALIKQTFADAEDLQYFSIESPYPTPWSNVCAAFSSIPGLQPMYFASYTTFFDMCPTSDESSNDTETTFSLFRSLHNFYKQRIECHRTSASLGWNRSVAIAPELAEVGCLTVDTIKKYIDYQMEHLDIKKTFTATPCKL